MYCRNCGKEIKDNTNFCEFCGHEVKKVKVEEKKQAKVNVKKKNPFIIGAIVIGVLFIGIVIILETNRDITKNKALEDAMLFMEEGNYEQAIDAFNLAFEKGDNDAEHYLLQAKAYVEAGDLYGAQQALQLGYANTKSEDLLHVEIWGPAQPFDLLVSAMEIAPNVRQKYIFDGKNIEVQYYGFGKVVFTNQYYYDESGKLVGCQLYDYSNYEFGAGDFLYLCPNDLQHCIPEKSTSIFLSFDFVYPQSDVVEVWGWNAEVDLEQEEVRATEQKLFATFYYENGKCVSMVTEDDTITLSYDEAGRVTNIDDRYGNQMLVTYSKQDDYIISINNSDEVLKFNSYGLNIEYCETVGNEDYHVTTYYNKVAEIYYGENLAYQITYDKKNRVSEIENVYDEITVTCTYEPYLGKERLWQVEYSTFDGETLTRIFQYDEKGRISEISQDYDSIKFSYDEDGRCSGYTYNADYGYQSVYQIIYDDLGRMMDIETQ